MGGRGSSHFQANDFNYLATLGVTPLLISRDAHFRSGLHRVLARCLLEITDAVHGFWCCRCWNRRVGNGRCDDYRCGDARCRYARRNRFRNARLVIGTKRSRKLSIRRFDGGDANRRQQHEHRLVRVDAADANGARQRHADWRRGSRLRTFT